MSTQSKFIDKPDLFYHFHYARMADVFTRDL